MKRIVVLAMAAGVVVLAVLASGIAWAATPGGTGHRRRVRSVPGAHQEACRPLLR